MTNSLSLGCDCKGSIHYLDAHFPTRAGSIKTVKNAICIHEEDDGILFKHSDFRDDSTIVTRARKLIIQQVFTVCNEAYQLNTVHYRLANLLLRPPTTSTPCSGCSTRTALSSPTSA